MSVFSSAPSLSLLRPRRQLFHSTLSSSVVLPKLQPSRPPAPKSPTTRRSSSSSIIRACRSPRPDEACQGEERRSHSLRRALVGGAVLAAALMAAAMGTGEEARAMGWWPEGPLAEEEFWDNVRRYGLYILTVSTGAIYTILQPIVELLKSPLTAILIIALLAGGFYLVSQVVGAMVGINDFSYDYSY